MSIRSTLRKYREYFMYIINAFLIQMVASHVIKMSFHDSVIFAAIALGSFLFINKILLRIFRFRYGDTVRQQLQKACPLNKRANGMINIGNSATYEDYLFSGCKKAGTCDGYEPDVISEGIINKTEPCGAWELKSTGLSYNPAKGGWRKETNCRKYDKGASFLPDKCIVELWKGSGCTNIAAADKQYPIWKKQSKAAIQQDLNSWKTVPDKYHRTLCYGPDKRTWPRVPRRITPKGYRRFKNSDSGGNDIIKLANNTPLNVLADACNSNANCRGFNDGGWLKHAINTNLNHNVNWQGKNLDLYVKEQSKLATSCKGWDCTIEGQKCPKGVPGAASTDYYCKNRKWTQKPVKFSVGHAFGPHRTMMNNPAGGHAGKEYQGRDMNYGGWTLLLNFYAYEFPQPGTKKYSVGHAWNPHRIWIIEDGRDLNFGGWTHLFNFYAFPTPQPGTIKMSVGYATAPYRIFLSVNNPRDMNHDGWRNLLTFYAFPNDNI